MNIYFPQWQGSGSGVSIASGAKTILDYLEDQTFVAVELSKIAAGATGKQRFDINNYDA